MKEYKSSHLRNIAVVGHGKSGKTSLVEALLFNSGAVNRLGKVDDGSAIADFEPEEIKRKMSISASLVTCEWEEYKLNFIDTPGYPDFTAEVKSALQAANNALIVVSAPSGIEVETEKVWEYAETAGLPRAFFINKMDREHADFDSVVAQLRIKFGNGVVPLQIPIGKESTFQGVVDLLTMHSKIITRQQGFIKGDIPEFMAASVEKGRQELIEAAAEYNNELLNKYLDGEEISEVEIAAALIDGISSGKLFPVLCGSALKNIGVWQLMNAMVEYMVSPCFITAIGTNPKNGEIGERSCEDAFSSVVFKTSVDPFVGRLSYIKLLSGSLKSDSVIYNSSKEKLERIAGIFTLHGKKQIPLKIAYAGDIVVTAKLQETCTGDTLSSQEMPIVYEKADYPEPMLMMAIKPKNKGDEDKVGTALQKILDEDQTLILTKNKETKDILINGLGELQLDILQERIKRKYGVEIVLSEPIIPYRETIRRSVKAEGKHKKQSGGHGQYGHVCLEISPQAAGVGNEFTETIFGGSVPRQYVPAVEKGVAETLAGGILAGYPVVDVKVNLYDGSYHTVDSSELAFKTAANLALRKGIMAANPILLEPIYEIEISAPEYYMGDIMGNLNSRRARIQGMDTKGKGIGVIKAQVPLAELYKYATDLRSLSQGRGSFQMTFSHYEELPQRSAETIIAGNKIE